MSPVVNASCQAQLQSLETSLPQTVLLTGPAGVGLRTIAEYVTCDQKLMRVITPLLLTKTSTMPQIGIEVIRELYGDTKGKTAGQQVVIIDDADKMTLGAQNSFLKLLEEPGRNVRFILTSHRPEKLLPTVRSRAQTYYFAPLTSGETEEFLSSAVDIDTTKLAQLRFVAEGLPAEILRLVHDEDYFTAMVKRMSQAKQLLGGDVYQRMSTLLGTKQARSEALALLSAMVTLLTRQPRQEHSELLARVLEAHDRIEAGGNLRLQMAAAVV